MPTVEVTLRLRTGPAPETAAWYLPGDAPDLWLKEISSWKVAHTTLRIVLLRDRDEHQIAGALVVPPSVDFQVGGHAIPFSKLGKNLFLPADAELFPHLTSSEVTELFDEDYLFAWLPGRGLTAAESSDVLSISELLQMPLHTSEQWDRAQTGLAFPQRIVGILPTATMTVDDVIDGGREDIGDRSDEIANLPKSPREPMSGVTGKISRAAMIGAAAPLLGLSKLGSMIGQLIPSGRGDRASGAGIGSGEIPELGALGKFANDLLNRASDALDKVRHKEIGRLLNMLDSDPDQGLKFAIPFGGGGQHRGRAAPSGRLSERSIRFSLSGLGGGGPVDYWDMSWEYQQKLLAKYRELAAREVRLGRHRRAAYVYAELLGDLNSAASALEQGGHFREAAVIYRDRLNNRRAAADCLERGALWDEAIEAYRELGEHEKVGDLCVQIERHEAAAEAYHAAAQVLLDQHDLLGASRIYEEKLQDPTLAIETLDGAWPNSSQARMCVHASFALRARLGYHEDSRQFAERLHADADRLSLHADVSELLAETFEKYPEAGIRDHARDLSRRILVSRMRLADRSNLDRFIRTLSRLTPEDRLLLRDGQRYRDTCFTQQDRVSPQAKVYNTSKPLQLKLVKQFDVGLDGAWRAAAALGEKLFLGGIVDGRIIFARCDVEGHVEKKLTPWPGIPVPSETELVLHARRSPLGVFAVLQEPLPHAIIFVRSEQFDYSVSGWTPKGHGVVMGATGGSVGQTWAIETRDDPALVCVGLSGTVVSTRSLLEVEDVPWDELITPVPMHALKDRVLIGVGNALLCVRDNQIEVIERFPSRITSLTGGLPYASPIVIASLEEGAVLIRCDSKNFARPFATELSSPKALLNQGQFAIAADENRIEVYENRFSKWDKGRLALRGETTRLAGRPIALLQAVETDRFIMVTSSGAVSVYQI